MTKHYSSETYHISLENEADIDHDKQTGHWHDLNQKLAEFFEEEVIPNIKKKHISYDLIVNKPWSVKVFNEKYEDKGQETMELTAKREVFDLSEAWREICEYEESPEDDLYHHINTQVIDSVAIYNPIEILICRLVKHNKTKSEILETFTLFAYDGEGIHW